ncbi:hypothetical protein [Granulicella sp. L60]|nr:hypothetical protein [Granulicella sp. L60]
MQIHSIGIDLGKTTFHLVALGASGKVLVNGVPGSFCTSWEAIKLE